jgi:bacillithiol biosynthesis cysteine-adding enzyme BshC
LNPARSSAESKKIGAGSIVSVPFSEIPGQSKLFVEYQNSPASLREFYPNAPASLGDLSNFAKTALENYRTDRGAICDVLAASSEKLNAHSAVLANIERLREPRTVAVITGQQTGLFTGPLYTIYKALTAVKLAIELTDAGTEAVPIFWAATEDHDLAEVSEAFVIGRERELVEIKLDAASDGISVGDVTLTESIRTAVDELFEALPENTAEELRHSIENIWKPGAKLGNAFIAEIGSLLGRFGLIVVDPLDANLKQAAKPLYKAAIENAAALVDAVIARDAVLRERGFHSQVLIREDHFPLFYHDESGRRLSVKRQKDGSFSVPDIRLDMTRDEFLEFAERFPERLSPAVMLRPVVQDHLFPTVCYLGGGAEIAYFAQNSVVYETLKRPVTPILHRQSFTFVDAASERTLRKYELEFPDIFAGREALEKRIVDGIVDPGTARLFADVEEKMNGELARLDRELSSLDPTLAKNLATRRRKIVYHIGALRKKARSAQLRSHGDAERRINAMMTALYPNGGLQERSVNVNSFLARFGDAFVDIIFDSIDLNDRGHRVVFL